MHSTHVLLGLLFVTCRQCVQLYTLYRPPFMLHYPKINQIESSLKSCKLLFKTIFKHVVNVGSFQLCQVLMVEGMVTMQWLLWLLCGNYGYCKVTSVTIVTLCHCFDGSTL